MNYLVAIYFHLHYLFLTSYQTFHTILQLYVLKNISDVTGCLEHPATDGCRYDLDN